MNTILLALLTTFAQAQTTLPLAGDWRFGFQENNLTDHIHLPGSTDQARKGPPNTAKPTLDGLYRLHPYAGPAFYQREIEIPANWTGKRVSLFLERAHWTTQVWLDGRDAGTQDSLIAPHVYDFGTTVKPGKHRLTIRVDNTLKIDLGRFVSIHYEGTQTNWNGIIGAIELRAADPVSIDDVQVYPDVDRKLARVKVTVINQTGQPVEGKLTLSATNTPARTTAFTASEMRTTVEAELPMGGKIRLWDEFSPSLYSLTANIAAGRFASQKKVTFGMRKIAVEGTRFTLNGRPLYLRGTLECAIFPKTAYPPTDVPSWQRIYRILKSYGLNHLRFHSWCPPEAAFTAADIEGVILQAEGPQANIKAGENAQRDTFIESEFLRIVRTYGNHPSFALMALGNEYGGPDALLTRWVDMLIKEDPRRLYTDASNAQKTANRQFTVHSRPRGIRGPGTDHDFRDGIDPADRDRPLLGHEIGQWTYYPNFAETSKYTGVLAPKNFDLVRDDLKAKHMLDLAPRFFEATGKQAVLLYKEEMEVLMRTPGHAGYQLLDLHDYPGQGTALIGLLDPFWDSKGFITPEAHKRYGGQTVPLLRMKKRTFTNAETFSADVELAHFGPTDLNDALPAWVIRGVSSGNLPKLRVPTGTVTPLGTIAVPLNKAATPAKYTVTVYLKGTTIANDWDIWVYPTGPAPTAPASLVVSTQWDDPTKAALERGARVILFPRSLNATATLPGKFLPVFWSPIWFPNRKPATMGILCDPKHPALAQFPTESYSNWQWWDLIENSRAMILDDAPAAFRPIVQVIDNFSRNHKLGNLFETKVGKGKLLVCSINLESIAGKQLLKSLYAYANSEQFNPKQELDRTYLDTLLQ